MTSRRTMLRAGLAAATSAAALGSLSACGPSAGPTEDSGLAVTWWGNALRNELTQEAIDSYVETHPDVAMSPQAGEWTSYWDRLATQVAGGTPPDLIQMDEAGLPRG
ncbi:extracellular solute-binding protein [Brachybacterium sp. FME24]|uniref:extracellular solute-binding protein n=1 Tax=Brachybacterium sp. FME24 TaxID=2742605 RepID=UPI001867CE02|nr:extracellular solute-binding protein [Brachybacterium sp. FME24]